MSQTGASMRSHDGRTVAVTGSAGDLTPGTVLAADLDEGAVVLAQVTDVSIDHSGAVSGSGVVVGALEDGTLNRTARPRFTDLSARLADDAELALLQAAVAAHTEIGTWLTGGQAPARLRAGGFNRHTFLCGQSGSGKTYALGVVLERLLIDTDLRVVILDPNADFVHLGELVEGADDQDADRLGRRSVTVLRSDEARVDGDGTRPLRMRFRSMQRAARAAVLQLDPVRDREEYNAFVRTTMSTEITSLDGLLSRLRDGGAAEHALLGRVENLGLDEWEGWALEDVSAIETIEQGGPGEVTVLDLGGFADPRESRSIALEVIDGLWQRRAERIPTLVVIDEAHNLAGNDPHGPVGAMLVERITQIAAEGRKYGLWLLLSTQRPSKIEPQILSQCDNLMLMRMNSPDDVAELSRVFGFVPPSMLAASTGFVQGEMLLAGPMTPLPMIAKVRARLTRQGGSDVSVPLV